MVTTKQFLRRGAPTAISLLAVFIYSTPIVLADTLNQNWYSSGGGFIDIPAWEEAVAVAIQFSEEANAKPHENPDYIFEPPINKFSFTEQDTAEGAQYLHFSYKLSNGWSTTTTREIRVDSVKPEPFLVTADDVSSSGPFPVVRFQAEDVGSGIDHFEILIDQKQQPNDAYIGLFGENERVNISDKIPYTIGVVAHDRAGNTRASSVAVQARPDWQDLTTENSGLFGHQLLSAKNISITTLGLAVLCLLTLLFRERRQTRQREIILRQETREIESQMQKIFSALRGEIHDQINRITKRKRLSEKEKEAVAGLTQALKVSEALIEKEISDVKKTLI